MKPNTLSTAIAAVERLRRLEEADAACLAAGRAINALAGDDFVGGASGEDWQVALDTFDELVTVRRLLAPRIKQTRSIIRAAKRLAREQVTP